MVRTRSLALRSFGALISSALVACGGGSGPSTPTPTPTPVSTPPPPVLVLQDSGVELKSGYTARGLFTTTRAGALDVTVDWTYSTSDLDTAITRGECSFEQLEANQCTLLAWSVSETAKPEKMHVDSAEAGTYSLFIENTSGVDERFSAEVVLTPRATGGGGVSASSRGQGDQNPLGRKAPARGRIELR